MSMHSILIVEDEAIVAADLANKIRQLGYGLAGAATTGEDAVALARRQRPALVVMDIHLAGPMDGVAAADTIRRECDVPVIFLTAHSDRATLEGAREVEAFGYILKPFDERDLHTQIEMALYKHAAERRLRASEATFRCLSENSPDCVALHDLQLRHLYVNPAIARIVGRPQADFVGKTVFEMGMPPGHAEALDRMLRQALDTHHENLADFTYLTPEGPRFYLWRCVPITGEQGIVQSMLALATDITAHKRAEDALRASNAELARFNRLMVDRELRMIELKEEINRLCAAAGQPQRYPLDFVKEQP